jgi:hypothetical protein
MRRAAPLILLSFVAIVAAVGRIYYLRLKAQAGQAPMKLHQFAPGTTSVLHGWTYSLELVGR